MTFVIERNNMNLLIISGSRNPDGQTAQAAKALLRGAVDNGGQGEIVYLPQMNIDSCRQCEDSGWGLCIKEGRCVIEDDLAGLVEKIRGANAVAFATPVYFSDLSESMKAFLDRLRRICRHDVSKGAAAGRSALGICVAGGSGGGAPACCASLETALLHCGFDMIDMVPVKRQNLPLKETVLESTGKWLMTHNK